MHKEWPDDGSKGKRSKESEMQVAKCGRTKVSTTHSLCLSRLVWGAAVMRGVLCAAYVSLGSQVGSSARGCPRAETPKVIYTSGGGALPCAAQL